MRVMTPRLAWRSSSNPWSQDSFQARCSGIIFDTRVQRVSSCCPRPVYTANLDPLVFALVFATYGSCIRHHEVCGDCA